MKKLLALATATIFCIGAGIEFILPKEDTFAINTETDHFYWSPNKEALDAATLYRLQNGVDRSKDACKTENRTPSRYAGDGWADKSPYWPFILKDGHELEITFASEYKDNEGRDESGISLGFQSITGKHEAHAAAWYCASGLPEPANGEASPQFYICAPATGEIDTSHYACDGGHTMQFVYELEGVQYCMSIKNAVCWYCCEHKDPSNPKSGCDVIDGVTVYKANTPDSLRGRTMTAGQLLCVGDLSTVVMVEVVST